MFYIHWAKYTIPKSTNLFPGRSRSATQTHHFSEMNRSCSSTIGMSFNRAIHRTASFRKSAGQASVWTLRAGLNSSFLPSIVRKGMPTYSLYSLSRGSRSGDRCPKPSMARLFVLKSSPHIRTVRAKPFSFTAPKIKVYARSI